MFFFFFFFDLAVEMEHSVKDLTLLYFNYVCFYIYIYIYKIKDFQVIDLEYFMTCLFLVILTLFWSVSLLCDCLSHLYSCFPFSYSYVFICYLLGHALPHCFSLFI